MAGQLNRRRFQYSIGTLLLVITVIAVLLGVQSKRVARQRKAVAAIHLRNGTILYDYQVDEKGKPRRADPAPPGPTWLRQLIGDDYFRTVVQVRCHGNTLANVEYASMASRAVWTYGFLVKAHAQVADTDLAHLRALPKLRTLSLRQTAITDQGMRHLTGLTHLRTLDLNTTRVSDDGLAHLRNLQLEELDLDGTLVTDAGLAHLRHVKTLKVVNLYNTRVTDAGIAELRRALPKAEVTAPKPVARIEHWAWGKLPTGTSGPR